MKLGTIVSKESYGISPLAELERAKRAENTIEVKPQPQESDVFIFPDVYVPPELDFSVLKNTNESLVVNGDIASENIDLLQDSIDIVRDMDEITPLAAMSIKAQLQNVTSVFPETTQQDVQYLDNILTSDSPMVVEATVESLMTSMASLRPIAVKSLLVSRNLSKFLKSSIQINDLQKRLQLSKGVLTRTERPVVDTLNNEPNVTHSYKELYPKIVKAVQNGYAIDEIPSVIGTNTDDKVIATTAIIAIAKGIEKVPLTQSREISGKDIGSLSEFIDATVSIQDNTIELLNKVNGSFSQGITNDQQMTQIVADVSSAISDFYTKITVLGKESIQSDALTLSGDRQTDVKIQFTTYANGPQVLVLSDGKTIAPRTYGQESYGIINPSDIPDLVDAIETRLISSFNAMKKRAEDIATLSAGIEKLLMSSFSDKIRMSDIAGATLTAVFNKLLISLKLTNSMMTVSTETVVNFTEAVADISRGIGIIIES